MSVLARFLPQTALLSVGKNPDGIFFALLALKAVLRILSTQKRPLPSLGYGGLGDIPSLDIPSTVKSLKSQPRWASISTSAEWD